MLLAAVVILGWTQPIDPAAPLRFTAPRTGLLHVSLHRDHGDVPGHLEVEGWPGELRSFTPENTQTHPGRWTFRAGPVERGQTYTIHTTARGLLDLEILDAPDHTNPTRATAAGMSWLIRAADAWLSNQPRHGAALREGELRHPEARACIACHVTQFTTRAWLTAVLNGHTPRAQSSFEGVMRRLRDNPRPLYGHDGVNWSRVIPSARTVSSRLPVLFDLHRRATKTSLEDDRDLILGAARFLLLADDCGAGQLRPEADGARPDVSGFEIGLQSWETFQLAARLEPADERWPRAAACMAGLLTRTPPANTIDASWRLIVLHRLRQPTQRAIADLLRHQQPDGRFALALDRTAPPADFVSYHVLYALAAAGHRGPAVDRLTAYTLQQQRPDGSWKGAPEYKGFDTPFRETHFAVMALSELSRAGGELQPLPFLSSRRPVAEDLDTLLGNDGPVDALASALDENLAQLREWQRAIRSPEDQARVETALRRHSQRQATALARALRQDNRARRLRILQAMAKVPGVDGFPARPRVGNDLDPPRLLSDDGAELERALLDCLKTGDRELAIAAIRAATALTDTLTPAFTAAVLSLPPTFGDTVEDAFGRDRRGRLSLNGTLPAGLPRQLAGLLRDRQPQALGVVLPLLAELEPSHPFVHEPGLSSAMDDLLRDAPTAEVLEAAAAFPRIADGPLMRTRVLEALGSSDVPRARAAVQIVVERFVVNPNLAAMTGQFLKHAQGLSRRMLLDALDTTGVRFRADLVSAYSPPRFEIPADASILGLEFVQDFVKTSLADPDRLVSGSAQDLVRKQERLRRAIPAPPAAAARAELDFAFFRDRVQPILEKPAAADGRSCVMCHASNARFPLKTDARANFHAAAQKVNLTDPLASPLLVKPLLPGVATGGDIFQSAHNGGERWLGRTGSAEYQTILEWIRSAR